MNVNPDGTITTATAPTCAKNVLTGCRVQETDCTWQTQGIDFTATFDTTFAQDGSSASGLASISATGSGAACSSTYAIAFVRQ